MCLKEEHYQTGQPEGLYASLFARFYDRVMAGAEKNLYYQRRHLLENLQGRVLEIGCGTGVNFGFYDSAVELLAIDPSRAMLVQAHQKAAQSPAQIELRQSGLTDLSVDFQFDVVVCTLVLCTVPNLRRGIEALLRLLKPSGKLLVLEHIRSHHKMGAWLQNLIHPLWQCCGQGCHINRPTDQVLDQVTALQKLECLYFTSTLPFMRAAYLRQ